MLPVFYPDFLRTWKLVSTTRSIAAVDGEDLLVVPLLHSPRFCVKVVESPLSTLCIPSLVLQEVKAAFPPASLAFLEWVLQDGAPCLPLALELVIGPLPHEPPWPPPTCNLSQLNVIQPVHLGTMPRKHLHTLVLHTIHFLTLQLLYHHIHPPAGPRV